MGCRGGDDRVISVKGGRKRDGINGGMGTPEFMALPGCSVVVGQVEA